MPEPRLKLFDTLPWKERWFIRGRLASAPLEAMAERARGHAMLDVGCGHGALVALLAEGHPDRHVVGIDPDVRKIGWAQASVGRNPCVELRACTIDTLARERPGAFDCLFVADVLYLLAPDSWGEFLTAARQLLRPGGMLVLKEAEDDGSWRALKALWQERLMVWLLRRTHSSGAIGFAPRSALANAITAAGFVIEETASYARGYSTPHILFTARVL
jgi:2-polyprenyl-3-methyl-5-hydroxy-6-metoxy-1,4-benzoquinol methylase